MSIFARKFEFFETFKAYQLELSDLDVQLGLRQTKKRMLDNGMGHVPDDLRGPKRFMHVI